MFFFTSMHTRGTWGRGTVGQMKLKCTRHSGGKWVVSSPGQIHGSWTAITAYCVIPTSRTSTAIALSSDLLTLYWGIDNVVVACGQAEGRLVVGWCWRCAGPGLPRVRPSVGPLVAPLSLSSESCCVDSLLDPSILGYSSLVARFHCIFVLIPILLVFPL